MDWPKTRSLGGSSVAPSPDAKPEQPPGSVSDVRLTQPLASDKPPPPPDFSKTQVLPVEEVAKVLGPRKAGPPRAAFDGARTQRLTASQLRAPPRGRGCWRGWLFACALIAIALGAYATLRGGARPRANVSPGGSTRAAGSASAARAATPASSVRAAGEPSGARPALAATPAKSASPTPDAAPAAPLESSPPIAAAIPSVETQRSEPPANARGISQRSAVDALAAGDAARAAALYAALAARDPHDRALAAAARILHARVARGHLNTSGP